MVAAYAPKDRAARIEAVNGMLPDHIGRFFEAVPVSPPENLLSKEGQAFMQMLPAVGREDIHAAQDGWPMRPHECEAHQSTRPTIRAIVDAAKGTRIVVINEAHDRPRHRDLIRQVAVALRPLGYSHFAAETFSDSVSSIEQSSYPLMEHGHYSNEPVFGALMRDLTANGYKLVPYEHRSNSSNVELDAHARASRREEGQADNGRAD